jgi:hypothetical protein
MTTKRLYEILEAKIQVVAIARKGRRYMEHSDAGPIGGECGSISRRVVPEVECVLYRAAILGGEFSSRILQRPEDGIRQSQTSGRAFRQAVFDPVLYHPLRWIHRRPRLFRHGDIQQG